LVDGGGVFGSKVAEMAGENGGLKIYRLAGYHGISKLQSVHTAGHNDISNVRYYTRFSAVNPPSPLMEGIQCSNKNSWPLCQTNSRRPSTAASTRSGVCEGDTVLADPEEKGNPILSTEGPSCVALLHCATSVCTTAPGVVCEFGDSGRDTVYPVGTGMNMENMGCAMSIVSMISTVWPAV